jgi:hypothetical protein
MRMRLPSSRWYWISCGALLAIFAAYAALWVHAHRGYLFDPQLQNDDARTSLFQFHRYGPERALADDPIAGEMMVIATPGHWLLYRALVPLVGLHAASKIVQGLCLGVLVAAAVVLARARRGGLACAIVLVFLALHTPFVVNRIAGGHGRGFAFPLMALWTAGVIARSHRSRFTAASIAALFYPPVLLLLLGAEGIVALWGLPGLPRVRLSRRLARYAFLVAVCTACVVPQVVRNAQYGRVHTLAEARQDPVFVHSPRAVLPLAPPVTEGGRFLLHPFRAHGLAPVAAIGGAYDALGIAGPMVIIAGLMALTVAVARRPRAATAAVALLLAAIAAYAAARIVAFRLYSPVRYLWYGSVAAALALAVTTLAALWPAYRDRAALAVRRNLAAFAGIYVVWMLTGDGMVRGKAPTGDEVVGHNGMSIDERDHAELYRFIRTLPANARIALHPADGAGISYWTARATTEHVETLQPWLVEPWQRLKHRTSDTLRALYATDPASLLRYCDRYEISHLLVRTPRYSEKYRSNAELFPPFDDVTGRALEGVERDELIIPRVTRQATVYYRQPWIVLDVARIRAVAAAPRSGELLHVAE